MGGMTETGWIAIATMVIGFLTLWLKLHYGVENKVTENTKISERTEQSLDRKLNGGIDSVIKEAVAPVHETLAAHVEQDKKDFGEIKQKFDTIEQYIHARNHDILNAINRQSSIVISTLSGIDKRREEEGK
jgi:hypothetical protein